ncbi:hypothetical protein EGR_07637 [Echinococcus granulosus]|uniref:Uncharacterized protein n=1 Tax=Echinococcus granulosus TaxID=6210 RepID=W6UAI9_ECHGR|nr:hypothetical protein EGR_07637 [Echinococcus granulosus]EUB57546.1 hypothetical protein EGR_07637 [Echinococcus granulosus]
MLVNWRRAALFNTHHLCLSTSATGEVGACTSPGKPQVCSSIISHRLVITESGDVDRSAMVDVRLFIILLFTSPPPLTLCCLYTTINYRHHHHHHHSSLPQIHFPCLFIRLIFATITTAYFTLSVDTIDGTADGLANISITSNPKVDFASYVLMGNITPTSISQTTIHEGHSILENAWVNEACNNGGSRALQKRICAKCNVTVTLFWHVPILISILSESSARLVLVATSYIILLFISSPVRIVLPSIVYYLSFSPAYVFHIVSITIGFTSITVFFTILHIFQPLSMIHVSFLLHFCTH